MNPRKISESEKALLKKSMQSFGDISSVCISLQTDQIICGNQRTKVLGLEKAERVTVKKFDSRSDKLVELGYFKTDSGNIFFRVYDWNEQQEQQACIAANKLGGTFDYVKLSRMLTAK